MHVLVSVIMSAFKPSSDELHHTIESVLAQSMTEFELIIIKDDELPTTLHLIKQWLLKDSRVRMIDNEQNLGLIPSLNKGLDQAKASLIARIDIGDTWEHDKLERQNELFMKNSQLMVCGTNLIIVDQKQSPLGSHHFPLSDAEIKKWIFKGKNPFAHPSVMFRKTDMRYNPNALYCEDYELWCRYSILGELINIPEQMTQYVIDTAGITNTKRSLMIANVTKVYCSFLKTLQAKDETHLHKGLYFIPENSLSRWAVWSNQYYSLAVLASYKQQKITTKIYFAIAAIFNPTLLVNKLQRIYCKIIFSIRNKNKINKNEDT